MITPACCSLCCRWCSFWRCWLLPLSVRPSHPGAGGRNRRYGVSESLEQWQRLLGLRLQPALLNTSWSAQEPGDRQQRPWRCRTRSAAGLDRAARARGPRSGQPQKALLQQGVKGRVLGEPLTRPALHEPELQNLAGQVPSTIHQSRACTLATLSSRVWSLSVRVLIFTVE